MNNIRIRAHEVSEMAVWRGCLKVTIDIILSINSDNNILLWNKSNYYINLKEEEE
jgi:hypothetical protein